MFRIGHKVVCVDAGPRRPASGWRWDGLLNEGSVYTVRAVVPSVYGGDYLCCHLVEIRREDDVPYQISRFRPVVEKSTDTGMEILKEILERETVKDPAPVNLLEDYRRLTEAMKAEAEWRNSVNR